MTVRIRTLQWQFLVVALVVVSGCGGKSTTAPSSSSSSSSFNGTWRGTGASGAASTSNTGVVAFDFTVANNTITRFSLTFRLFPRENGCTFTATTPGSIANNAFTYNFANAGFSTVITGTFSSSTQGTGSVGRVDLASVSCAGTINGFISGDSITFTKS
jgi:hypothetical protein